MERIKERKQKFEVAVSKNGKYFKAKISINFAGRRRLEGGGKTEELAVLCLLTKLNEYIDELVKSRTIKTKITELFIHRFTKSIADLNIISSEIPQKTLEIVTKINQINQAIDDEILYLSNIVSLSNSILSDNIDKKQVNYKYAFPFKNIVTDDILDNNNKNEELCILKDYAIDWLKYKFSLCEKTTDNPKPNSRKTIDGYYKLLLDIALPYFNKSKKLYLSDISESTIKELLKTQKSVAVSRQLCIMLKVFFNDAVKNGKIKESPLANIKTPSKVKKSDDERDDYIESDEQYKYINMFEKENTDMSLLFETMLLTGIRPEEACGLKWKCFDLETDELIINNAYKSFDLYDDDLKVIGHYRDDDKLKTEESYRRVPIIYPILKQLLLEHKEKQRHIFKTSRAITDKHRKWTEEEYIFLGRAFRPYVAETLSSALPKLCDKYNLKRVTPYSLRHSFATYCSEQKMEPNVLMKIMGHSNYQTTQRYYIVISSKHKKKAMHEVYKKMLNLKKVV